MCRERLFLVLGLGEEAREIVVRVGRDMELTRTKLGTHMK
jgi:hypothetical protein